MIDAISQSSASTASATFSEPAPSGLSVEERVLALIIYNQSTQLTAAEDQVNLNAEQLEKLRDDVLKALDKAREAQKDSGFWGDLADLFGSDLASIATAVAAVAAVVATGGSAAAILAGIAAAATIAADHAEELGIPKEVAIAIAVAATVAGLACGDMKGLFEVSKKAADLAKDVQLYAGITAGGAMALGGGASMVQGSYEHDVAYFRADARNADGRQDLVSSDMDSAIDSLSTALERQNAAASVISNIQKQSAGASSRILDNWGGAA